MTNTATQVLDKRRYIIMYLDADDQLKIEKFLEIVPAMTFVGEFKIPRDRYLLVHGEYLYGPADIEMRIPEALASDIDVVATDSGIELARAEDISGLIISDQDEEFRI